MIYEISLRQRWTIYKTSLIQLVFVNPISCGGERERNRVWPSLQDCKKINPKTPVIITIKGDCKGG